MNKKLLVLNVSLSGVNKHLFGSLKSYGWDIDSIEVPKPKLSKYINMLRTFQFNKNAWRDRFYETLGKDPLSFKLRTQFCEKEIKNIVQNYDAVFQIGGMYAPSFAKLPVPYFTYNDYTMKLASREYPKWAPFTSTKIADQWYQLEGNLYKNAARVFTFSKRTRDSVINDYGASVAQAVAVGAGANLENIPEKCEKTYDGKTILFVGIDFVRKGGYVLLEAFKKVKKEIPKAKLIIVGPDADLVKDCGEGVEMRGLVRDRDVVRNLYHKSSVFVMPSFGDPFPNVLLEAMAYQIPCIAADASGMPEQIEHDKTGFIVPVNNSDALAEKIIQLLKDKELMKKMGSAGYERVTNAFLWKQVGQRINAEMEKVIKLNSYE